MARLVIDGNDIIRGIYATTAQAQAAVSAGTGLTEVNRDYTDANTNFKLADASGEWFIDSDTGDIARTPSSVRNRKPLTIAAVHVVAIGKLAHRQLTLTWPDQLSRFGRMNMVSANYALGFDLLQSATRAWERVMRAPITGTGAVTLEEKYDCSGAIMLGAANTVSPQQFATLAPSDSTETDRLPTTTGDSPEFVATGDYLWLANTTDTTDSDASNHIHKFRTRVNLNDLNELSTFVSGIPALPARRDLTDGSWITEAIVSPS